jgi:hypothetical protein
MGMSVSCQKEKSEARIETFSARRSTGSRMVMPGDSIMFSDAESFW